LHRAHALTAEIWEIEYALMEIRYMERMHAAAEEYDEAAMDEARRIYLEMDRSRLIREQEAEWQRIERADAYARLAEMREDIRDTELHAPFSGTVTYTAPLLHGAPVNTVTPIVYIAPAGAVPFVEYMGVTFYISGASRIFLHNVRRFTAEIDGQIIDLEYITPTREEVAYNSLHGLPIRTRFTLPQGYDFPMGSSVRLFVYLTYIENTLRIPTNALFVENNVPYVYRWENEAWVTVRPTLGARSTAFVEVLDGLSEGDVILVN
jgi:multidrug efflux pump subunit AcrA (membrane-fusion protein)